MLIMNAFFDINNAFIAFPGYPLSYVEFIGTAFGLVSVWLATRANIHTWTTGIVNIFFFFLIYYQLQLYSDMFLQVFFLGASVLGLYNWFNNGSDNNRSISFMKKTILYPIIISMFVFSFLLGRFMQGIHLYLPGYFPKPAAFPFADAFTTVLSVYATLLMAYKKIECWVLWILVDVVCIVIYWKKGVYFISAEYLVFLLMCISGFVEWIKKYYNGKRIGIG